MAPLLEINNLQAGFETPRGTLRAVDGVSLRVERGEAVGLVGESGCGKSATAYSVLNLLPYPSGKILGGSIKLNGRELTTLSEKEISAVRGQEVSMIFQEPMSALNPVMRIGKQIAEGLILHQKVSPKDAEAAALKMLERVGIPEPARRLQSYPHELSGGQRQRVVIAMALICKPQLIIADEPTTALDVTLQVQIVELLEELRKETGTAILFITHDLGLVKKLCQRTYVMYAGQIVEEGATNELFANPQHPYTRGLLGARPHDSLPPKSPLQSIEGRLPSYWEWSTGCRFAARCPWATKECEAPQALRTMARGEVRCWKEGNL